jgi:lipopolysaccharide export system protein LptA
MKKKNESIFYGNHGKIVITLFWAASPSGGEKGSTSQQIQITGDQKEF